MAVVVENKENSGTPGKSEDREKFQCPRCNWYETENPRAPEADLKEYLRCMLGGGKRFIKTYKLYDGALQLTFRTLSSSEADRVNAVVLRNEFDTPDELSDVGRKAKLLFYLIKVNAEGRITEFTAPELLKQEDPEKPPLFDYSKAAVLKEYDSRFKEYDETMLRILFRAFSLFEALQRLLISDGFDDAFWKGAGPF